MMATSHIAAPAGTKAIIVDYDKTFVDDRIAAAIGKAYILRELKHGHFLNFMHGVQGSKRVMEVVKAEGENGNAEGLKAFYDVLIGMGLGKKDEIREFAARYLRKHQIEAVGEFLYWTDVTLPRILATTGGSTAAQLAAKAFDFEHVIANEDLFDDHGGLTGVKLTIRNGRDKRDAVLDLLRTLEIPIEKCVMIGDGQDDIPLFMAVPPERRFASPLASEEVRRIPGITVLRSDLNLADVMIQRNMQLSSQ